MAALFTVAAYAGKPAGKVYIFGFATVLSDSTVYLTDIQQLDSAVVYGKGNFLYSRNNYSYQLHGHMEKIGVADAMCVTSFATTQKKIEKKYLALRKKYTKKGNYTIKYIERADFTYQGIMPEEGELLQGRKKNK
ncbi:MAG: hypothetical protein IJM81_00475 [Prevotella sp.]|nr:hypothetical protein [Prevotella sp.]